MIQMSKGVTTTLIIGLFQGLHYGQRVFSHHAQIGIGIRSGGTKLVCVQNSGNAYARLFPYFIHGFRVEGCFHEDSFYMEVLYEIHHLGSGPRSHPTLFSGLLVQRSGYLEPEFVTKIPKRVMVSN